MNGVRLAQIGRIPLLIVLLLLAASGTPGLARAMGVVDFNLMWLPWTLLVGAAAAFAAVALWRRETRHPWAVLVVEGVVAGVIGLIPPLAWIMWFGVGTLVTFGATTGNLYAHALAVVWLTIVVRTAVRQRPRDAFTIDDAPPTGSAT